jgi:hypothetical protein
MQLIEFCPFPEAALFTLSDFVITYPFTTYLSKHLLPKALKNGKMKTVCAAIYPDHPVTCVSLCHFHKRVYMA